MNEWMNEWMNNSFCFFTGEYAGQIWSSYDPESQSMYHVSEDSVRCIGWYDAFSLHSFAPLHYNWEWPDAMSFVSPYMLVILCSVKFL